MRPTRAAILLAIGLSIVWVSPALAQDEHVRAQLLADVSAIPKGQSFQIGVYLQMDPGWHVYWKNPGDSGIATRVRFTPPAGYQVSSVDFPAPQQFNEPGGILNFGYENSVLLIARVTPTDPAAADAPRTFSAQVNYLVCKDECVPGKQELTLRLPSGQATPDHPQLFQEWERRIPVPATQSSRVASVAVKGSEIESTGSYKGNFVVDLRWKNPPADPASIAFFPGPLDDYKVAVSDVRTTGNETQVKLSIEPLSGKQPPAATLEGVVEYKEGTDALGVVVPVDLPNASGKSG